MRWPLKCASRAGRCWSKSLAAAALPGTSVEKPPCRRRRRTGRINQLIIHHLSPPVDNYADNEPINNAHVDLRTPTAKWPECLAFADWLLRRARHDGSVEHNRRKILLVPRHVIRPTLIAHSPFATATAFIRLGSAVTYYLRAEYLSAWM